MPAETVPVTPWLIDWAWGLPLIILVVIFHVGGLLAIHKGIAPIRPGRLGRRPFSVRGTVVLGFAVLSVTLLHGGEAAIWAACYVIFGALPDSRTAMLYSIEAMTTYGHSPLLLAPHWQMLGALEALNGMILFGLTTAYLFAVLQSTGLGHSQPYSSAPTRGAGG